MITLKPIRNIIHDFAGFVPLWEKKSFEGPISSVAISPDDRYFATGTWDGFLTLWETKSAKRVRKYEGHEACIFSIQFDRDGKTVFSSSWDRLIKRFDVETGELLTCYKGHSLGVMTVFLPPTGDYIFSGSYDKTIRKWNVESGMCEKIIKSHSGPVDYISVGEKSMVSASYDEKVLVHDVESGELIRTFTEHHSGLIFCSLLADQKHVISACYDGVFLKWELSTGKIVSRVEYRSGISDCIYMDIEEKLAFGTYRGRVSCVDFENGKLFGERKSHRGEVSCFAVSKNDRFLISGSGDHTLSVWNIQDVF